MEHQSRNATLSEPEQNELSYTSNLQFHSYFKGVFHQFGVVFLSHCQTHTKQFKKRIKTNATEQVILSLIHAFVFPLTPGTYNTHNATQLLTGQLQSHVYNANRG